MSPMRAVNVRLALMFAVAAAMPAGAGVLVAGDAGFVTEAGGSSKGDGTLFPPATFNYSAGRELHYSTGALGSPLAPMDRKNYFLFDLSGVSGPIVSATLEVYAGILESVDPFEVYDLVAPLDPGAAVGDASMLLASNAVGPSAFDEPLDPAVMVAAALHGNLSGDPTPLGSVMISPADDGSMVSIALGPFGLAYLNALAGGPVLLGGSVPTALPPASPQQPFGFTGLDIPGGDPLTPTLVLEVVPEPASLWLLAVSALALSTSRGRSRG